MRSVPDPGFAGDDGSAAAEVAAALAAYDVGGGHSAALVVVQHARVLVPVVAMLDEVEVDGAGAAHDKTSEMATVLTTGADGRTALLAFTGLEAMRSWDPAARPVPVPLAAAAQAAAQEGASALVLDLAGPVLFAVEDEDLRALAEGLVLVPLGDEAYGWARRASDGDL